MRGQRQTDRHTDAAETIPLQHSYRAVLWQSVNQLVYCRHNKDGRTDRQTDRRTRPDKEERDKQTNIETVITAVLVLVELATTERMQVINTPTSISIVK